MKALEYIKKNKEKLPDMKDLLILLGGLMVGNGLYMVYPPAAWIICGVFIVYLGWPKGR